VALILEGKKYRKLDRDCQAVSEVIGQILMIAVVVLAFSSIAITIFSEGGAVNPPHTPKADLQENISAAKDTIEISHEGGDTIDLREIEIVVYINGQEANFNMSDPGFQTFTPDGSLTNETFMLGDRILINTSQSRGIDFTSDDSVDLYFVHKESSQVIQRARLQSGGGGGSGYSIDYWITPFPFGTAVDTSGGNISIQAVKKAGDGSYTTYYPPSKFDPNTNSTHQSFAFNIDAARAGITEIHNVTVQIVYNLKDSSFQDVFLDISVTDPESWIRVNSSMPEFHTGFQPCSINVTSYVTTINELENLKVRFVAVTNANYNPAKWARIDYLGLKVR
jgi:FlaG/FlaF family flagellin (archaellin)